MEGEIMSAPPAMRQPAPRSALRRLVARPPVARWPPLVPRCALRRARRDGGVCQRDLWSCASKRAGGEMAAAVHGGVATTTAIDRVVQSCRGDRLYGLLAGEPSRLARAVEGQLDRYGPLRAVASAELDGRQRIRPRPASHRPRFCGHPGDTTDVRAYSHDVALQRHRIQRAAGGTFPLLL